MTLPGLVRSRPLRFMLAGMGSLALALSVLHVTQARRSGEPGAFLSHPDVRAYDVFDLPEFDAVRRGGKLDVRAAERRLETLSDHDLPAAQVLFDEFAWKTFIALNRPARADGEPDATAAFTDQSAPRVWEYWKPTADVFLPDGGRPASWGGRASMALDHFKAGWRAQTTVDQGLQAFSGPLIDQHGRWAHYVSLINKPEFSYIVKNELYNLEGQAAFTRDHRIDFPKNTDTQAGAIEIKLAWKPVDEAEVRSGRFFIRRLPIVTYRPAGSVAAPALAAHVSGRADERANARTHLETVGLVGMHIAMRTRSSPQWIWATFEQVDNTRLDPATREPEHPLPLRPSFSNPNAPEALVRANILPAYNAAGPNGPLTEWDESKPMAPVEVLRVVPPPQGTADVNRIAQAFLGERHSVFRFYELNGTQWPTHPAAPAVPGGQGSAPESIVGKVPGNMVPVYLTNATMETYFQKGYQQAGPLEQDDRVPTSIDTTPVFGTESCAGCHFSAGAAIGFRKDDLGRFLRGPNGAKVPIFGENGNDGRTANAGFSWLLQLEAKSKEPPAPLP